MLYHMWLAMSKFEKDVNDQQVHWNGDDYFQNVHLGRYMVRYTASNQVLKLHLSIRVKLNCQWYIRRYTFINEKNE